ncbi:MAG: hypothetical protein Q4D51_06685 [Eubacteriales bacterium]|nr:hypothetical protein [Eubacteriales bacterium]
MSQREIEEKIAMGLDEMAPDIWSQIEDRITLSRECEEIEQPVESVTKWNKKFGWMAVSVAAMLMVVFNFCFRSTTTVVIDVNPSVSVALNGLDQVKHVEGLNEDGKKVVSALEKNHWKNLQSFVPELITEMERQDYIKEQDAILISVVGNDKKREKYKTSVTECVDKLNQEQNISLMVYCQSISKEEYNRGTDCDGGKSHLQNEVIEKCHMSQEEVQELGVTQLVEMIKQQDSEGGEQKEESTATTNAGVSKEENSDQKKKDEKLEKEETSGESEKLETHKKDTDKKKDKNSKSEEKKEPSQPKTEAVSDKNGKGSSLDANLLDDKKPSESEKTTEQSTQEEKDELIGTLTPSSEEDDSSQTVEDSSEDKKKPGNNKNKDKNQNHGKGNKDKNNKKENNMVDGTTESPTTQECLSEQEQKEEIETTVDM